MSWVFFCFIEPLHVISSNWRRFLTFFLHTVDDWGVVERFANYEVYMYILGFWPLQYHKMLEKNQNKKQKAKLVRFWFRLFFSKRLSDSTQKGTRFAEFFSKNISTNTPFFNNYCFVSIFGRQKHLMGVRSSIQFQKNTLTMYIAVLLICWSK